MFEFNQLTQSERDELTVKLDDDQRKFINELLKRGRKTVFANVLAKGKAGSVDETYIAEVASQWELIDYIDAGPSWRENGSLYCECGRNLRYQYVVLNKETSELKKFGINHFEEHAGIPPHLVKEIVKGIEKIDYEGDELLLKIANDWTLEDIGIHEIPQEVDVPKDILLHFEYNVPLLDRQIKSFKPMVLEFIRERERERLRRIQEEQATIEERKKIEITGRREQLLQTINWKKDLELSPPTQAGIIIYLEDLEDELFLISDLCDYLVTYHEAPDDTFSSGTFKIFPQVCLYLENYLEDKSVEFVERKYGMDREYRVTNN